MTFVNELIPHCDTEKHLLVGSFDLAPLNKPFDVYFNNCFDRLSRMQTDNYDIYQNFHCLDIQTVYIMTLCLHLPNHTLPEHVCVWFLLGNYV